MQRLLSLLLLLCLVLTAPAQTRSQQQRRPAAKKTQRTPTKKEQLQARQRNVRSQRQANQKRQQELEKQVKKRMQDVEHLSIDITDKQEVIDSLRTDIQNVTADIAVLDSQLTALQAELEERRLHYIKSARYMYRNRHAQNQLVFVLSAENFNQLFRRMRFMNEYTSYQKAQGEAVKQKGEQVSAKLDELNTAKAELNTLIAKGKAEQQQLEAKKAEQQKMVADLQKEQQTVKKLITQQQKEEAELNARIDKLIAEEIERARKAEEERQRRLAEQRRREEEQRQQAAAAKNSNTRRRNNTPAAPAATGSKKSASSATAYSPADPDRQLSGSFANNKGRLPVPITGSYRVTRGFGPYSIAGVTLQSNGIHLQGQDGAQARCVFDGEVSRVYNPGNGYVVMVRHGRYISVYCFLSSVSVSQGQRVKTNQILGNVGSSHILQFRLQNWDKLLNPRPWLSRL